MENWRTGKSGALCRVVFDLNVEGQSAWSGLLNQIRNLKEALGQQETDVAVVSYGKGIGLLLSGDPEAVLNLKELTEAGVQFYACQNTLRRSNISPTDLFPQVGIVDSGVAELVLLQQAGWAYIKVV